MRCKVLVRHKEPRLSEKLCEHWCEEAAEDGLGPCESEVRTSRWRRANRKAEVEEADGSSSREGVGVFPSLHGGKNLEVEEDLSIVATLFWAEGVWMGRWKRVQQKDMVEAGLSSADMETGESACRSSDV